MMGVDNIFKPMPEQYPICTHINGLMNEPGRHATQRETLIPIGPDGEDLPSSRSRQEHLDERDAVIPTLTINPFPECMCSNKAGWEVSLTAAHSLSL